MCAMSMTEIQNRIEGSGVIELDCDDELDVTSKVKTNIAELDGLLGGGLRPGLHCVTGGPSSYKSALLLQIAYLAAMDGRGVTYITDEISSRECWQRLTARRMQVDKLVGDGANDVPPWASLEEAARVAARDDDTETLERIGNAIDDVKHAEWRSPDYGKLKGAYFRRNGLVWLRYNRESKGYLSIDDMGRANAPERLFENGEFRLFEGNTRYLVSAIQHSDEAYLAFLEGECENDLLIIDAVNSLRLFEVNDGGCYRDHMPEPRARMEQIVETLDEWGRSLDIAVVGVFHGNRTRGQNQQHPSMGDFKETSAIEYHATSAWEIVRADDMRWSGHPKPPKVPEGTEAVALYLLKSRAGKRTEHNGPIWLCADGAHNLIYPLE